MYLAFGGYFEGGKAHDPKSAPALLAQIGYGFFVLIIIASYTANLATILVTKSNTQGGVTSIQVMMSSVYVFHPRIVIFHLLIL